MDKTQVKEKLVVMKVEVDNIGSITECKLLNVCTCYLFLLLCKGFIALPELSYYEFGV
jgi:hypothetical protein